MANEPPFVEPLTRGNYKRLPAVEGQITAALILEPETLLKRAQQRDETASDFLSAEALVYFIRQAIRNNDNKVREPLFRELLERCKPHFSGKFRGFGREDREDLQSEVMNRVVEDLFAPDDRGDFMQVRFWKYLEKKCIDACRIVLRHTKKTESLDASYSSDGISERRALLETEIDPGLLPEEFAMISEGLAELPLHLRRVFMLRHYFGMKIGPDKSVEAADNEPTIAKQFNRSGRTIRNWLKEADKMLASFREKQNGE